MTKSLKMAHYSRMFSVNFDDIYYDQIKGSFGWTTTIINIWYNKCQSCLFANIDDNECLNLYLFLDLFFCHEIKTILITNVRGIDDGYKYDSVHSPIIYTLDLYKHNVYCRYNIESFIKKFYGYKVLIYNKGYFMKIKNEYINNITLNCNFFSNIFPKDIINSIRDNMLPEWTKYHRHYVKNKYYKQFINDADYCYYIFINKNWPMLYSKFIKNDIDFKGTLARISYSK